MAGDALKDDVNDATSTFRGFDDVLHECGFVQCMTEISIVQNTRTDETAIKQFMLSFVRPRHI